MIFFFNFQSICGHLKSHDISIKDYEARYRLLNEICWVFGKTPDNPAHFPSFEAFFFQISLVIIL